LLLQSRVPKVDSALDCTFLIVPSVFSNVYLSLSLDCPFLIAPSMSCAQGWQCSGLSILDCYFNLVCPKLTVLWIVHSRKDKQECTIQSTVNYRHTRLKEQSRMDNPEYCPLYAHSIEGAIKNGQSRALSTLGTRHWRSNQEWTIQSTVKFGHTRLKEQSRMDNPEHCQPWAHEIEGSAPSMSCAQCWQCSGLSILDCSFILVCPNLTVLWIVHSWLLLQCCVHKVDSTLDCPILIAPSISCA
jgi:hypothetical protein